MRWNRRREKWKWREPGWCRNHSAGCSDRIIRSDFTVCLVCRGLALQQLLQVGCEPLHFGSVGIFQENDAEFMSLRG